MNNNELTNNELTKAPIHLYSLGGGGGSWMAEGDILIALVLTALVCH